MEVMLWPTNCDVGAFSFSIFICFLYKYGPLVMFCFTGKVVLEEALSYNTSFRLTLALLVQYVLFCSIFMFHFYDEMGHRQTSYRIALIFSQSLRIIGTFGP